MLFIIDVQGFQSGKSNNFLVKEIAIINVENGSSTHRFVVMPTCFILYDSTVQRRFLWNTRNCHGLEWENYDSLQYEQLSEFIKNTIKSEEATVLVKGLEKKRWLEKIIPNNIEDLHDQNCPALEKLTLFLKSNHCKQHLYSNNLSCALENVHILRSWYIYCKQK